MGTELLYFTNTYALTAQAKVLHVTTHDDNGGTLVLDRTVFYPQGGGQPSDVGRITTSDGSVVMTVDKVVLVPEDRTVVHHGRVGDRLLCEGIVGSCVHLHVDPDTRLRHARLHTAGHVLAHATHQCVEGVLGTKGHHFPDGSYVEFSGVVPPEAGDIIQERINRLVAENAEVIVEVLRRADMVQRCAVLPDRLPEGDEFRVVSFGERSGSPCGGTHVQSLGELGRVVVGKIRTRKGKSKISYTVEGPRAGPSPL